MTRHSSARSDAPPVPDIRAVLDRFAGVRTLVVGDVMLDRYIWGEVERISPEAPVPVVRVADESLRAGGAGNVITNIRALGGQVIACGLVGRDQDGRRLVKELASSGAEVSGLLLSQRMATISKTRIIAHSQQLVRLDREPRHALDSRVRARLRAFVRGHVSRCDVVVVSDYGKGMIDAELLGLLATLRRQHGFVYVIDPKPPNFAHYREASVVKPNLAEAGQAAGLVIHSEASLAEAGTRLLNRWQTPAVLISRGEAGLSLFQAGGAVRHFPTVAREVFDVTGAGDTVQATCALALGAGTGLETATIFANHAAGVVVGKVGTATVSPAELRAVLYETYPCEA